MSTPQMQEMPSITASMIPELEMEAETTRRLFDAVPTDKLTWKPHDKSMSLGELCWHIAGVNGSISELSLLDAFDPASMTPPPTPENFADIRAEFERGTLRAKEILAGMDNEKAMSVIDISFDGKFALSLPTVALLRSIMMNHSYHHRGQLSVYLRELDVPLPSIYGPSADVNPFA